MADPEEGWGSSPVKTGWERWGCSAWSREALGELIRKMGIDFLAGPVAVGQWIIVLNYGTVDLD